MAALDEPVNLASGLGALRSVIAVSRLSCVPWSWTQARNGQTNQLGRCVCTLTAYKVVGEADPQLIVVWARRYCHPERVHADLCDAGPPAIVCE
jgi:hypothetical protein